jgi:3-phenylpropionate/trans-cinnamate dioxygenase ferredoxin subunit
MTNTSGQDTSGSDSAAAVTIRACANGPYEVSGLASIVADDGSLLKEGEMAYLCRCGASARKPFCDGTHTKIGFQG